MRGQNNLENIVYGWPVVAVAIVVVVVVVVVGVAGLRLVVGVHVAARVTEKLFRTT